MQREVDWNKVELAYLIIEPLPLEMQRHWTVKKNKQNK